MDINQKEIYYVEGDRTVGPVSESELLKLQLADTTLIWHEGIINWIQLKDIHRSTASSSVPPPIPHFKDHERKDASPVFAVPKKESHILDKPKLSYKELSMFFIWTGLHFIALITSYSGIKFFNAGKPDESYLWPFVTFFSENKFNGVFYVYDWSEFVLYVFGTFIFFIAIKLFRT